MTNQWLQDMESSLREHNPPSGISPKGLCHGVHSRTDPWLGRQGSCITTTCIAGNYRVAKILVAAATETEQVNRGTHGWTVRPSLRTRSGRRWRVDQLVRLHVQVHRASR